MYFSTFSTLDYNIYKCVLVTTITYVFPSVQSINQTLKISFFIDLLVQKNKKCNTLDYAVTERLY
jgi:hypothetical protein